jgi:alpha-L-fucosidase 2
VTYDADRKLRFTREYVAHLERDVILVRVRADGEPFDAVVWLDRTFDPDCELAFGTSPGELTMDGRMPAAVAFRATVAVWHEGGEAGVRDGRRVVLAGVRDVILSVNAGTNATGGDPAGEAAVEPVSAESWDRVIEAHRCEHARHYGTVRLEIPFEEPDLPTDERVRRVRAGESDPGLALLYFNFGRYLLCASSATAQLPANLQGKWNEDLRPPWECDLHHDVNLQMNYWPAEPGGMPAYVEALLQHIERFVPHARKAASDLYGCGGVYFPIQTDPWGRATPESFGWAVWIGAAPWLAQHVWWHYEYGRDMDYLRERAYPFLKEVAAFYEDYLVEDEDGALQAVPSQSPENRFREAGTDLPVSLCISSTMDVALAWDVLTHAVRAAELLGVDGEKRAEWQTMRDKLPELKVGSRGQLLEWNEEFEEVEPGHRHLSHLFPFFPGEQITREGTPGLFAAALRSLELRLAAAGGHTGWSRAWVACCFARGGRGNEAFGHLQHLVTDFASDTLLDLHPPRIFQVDGNLGGVAAVLEMLLQSYGEELHFLPALPDAWPGGRVRGLRARGGFTVDLEWEGGRLRRAAVVCVEDRECVVKCADGLVVRDEAGSEVQTRTERGKVFFPVRAGERYELTPAG